MNTHCTSTCAKKTCSIIVDLHGLVMNMDEQAHILLSKYFGDVPPSDNRLPDHLSDWLIPSIDSKLLPIGNSRPMASIRIMQGNDNLVVSGSIKFAERQIHLCLEEQTAVELSLTRLQELGLSQRETEILYWIIHDKSNQKIGEMLNVSSRTVQKHCENLYEKLAVNNRGAAIVQAFQRLGIISLS